LAVEASPLCALTWFRYARIAPFSSLSQRAFVHVSILPRRVRVPVSVVEHDHDDDVLKASKPAPSPQLNAYVNPALRGDPAGHDNATVAK
jgi:hypothetical protein